MHRNLSRKSREFRVQLIRMLAARKEYREAFQVVVQDPTDEDAKNVLLSCLLDAVRREEDPLILEESHSYALIKMMSMELEQIYMRSPNAAPIVHAYCPYKVRTVPETFKKSTGFDHSSFTRSRFVALERLLKNFLLVISIDETPLSRLFAPITEVQSDNHQRDCPCSEKEICSSLDLASFVLSACKPLHYGSFQVERVRLKCSFVAGHFPLFYVAVSRGLLEEARLLYETGAVNNSELAYLAQTKPQIQKVLDEDKDTPMGKFLCSVMRQPRSLLSAASLEVSMLLGHDVRGRQDRAKSLGLPHTVYDEVMFIRQASDYRHAVKMRCEKKKRDEN